MARGPNLLETLRGLTGSGTDGCRDDELLERFAVSRDADAFAILVRRHGPLVWGVCRRVLCREHDAEDAFQATFLVLARGARSVRRRSSLRSWLYGVAMRVALRARDKNRHRRDAPKLDASSAVEDPATAAGRSEITAMLDEEVRRLPERYRQPVVLCYLLGRTNDEAARELGCPRGTVAIRLARARERLRQRLLRRGLGSAGALPALLQVSDLPDRLLLSTRTAVCQLVAGRALAGSAFTLAQGVLTTMLLDKCKAGVLVLLVVSTLAGAGFGARTVLAQIPSNDKTAVAAAPAPDENQKPVTAKAALRLKELLTARQSAALAWYRSQYDQFEQGKLSLDAVLESSQGLLKSDLDLATSREQRIVIREAHLKRMKQILTLDTARFEAGRISVGDLKRSEYTALDAEIELEREKAR